MSDWEWDYRQPFLLDVTVAPDDIDELGHTNNGVYTRWCEQIAWQHSDQLGLNAQDYQRLQRAMAIQQANYQYLAASFAGENIAIATWLTGFDKRLKMQRRFQMVNRATGVTIFRGQWDFVCISLASNKPTRIPAEFIAVYTPHIVDP
ncbi:thioesterase family protein [Oceanicoccus sp. KOV_DT_Chl]|uniref:acyl-CoA thioesterase n=1 Tax=Oceanicoccus sp. KOV_DT_Chl TaxID=1904639 RepID=UPI000C797A98|nr:acyl-CoA thioesterase [Oceanicoccus sp. KOV_DT_Chl]